MTTVAVNDTFGCPTAPLPLTRIQALQRAAELHRMYWPWTAIARAMGEYHGHYLSAASWRHSVHYMGWATHKRTLTPAKRDALDRLHESHRRARMGEA